MSMEPGGMMARLRAWPEPPELVGLVRLPAWPGGPIDEATFQWLMDEMLSALNAAGPVDAVLLALHGALVGEGHPDVEGELLVSVRRRIGPKIPLVATLDLHAHLTPKMVAAADALALYHTMPHVDTFETGERGAEILRRMLFDGARPTPALVKVPAIVPAERQNTETDSGAAVDLKRRLQELERWPDVLSAGLAPTQPWLDVPDLGAGVLVVTDNNPVLAERLARETAQFFWERRREYLPDLCEAAEAVRSAFDCTSGLTAMSDGADATTSGAPGDSVWILAELVKYDWPKPTLMAMTAPEVVEEARRRGVGAAWCARLGGVRDIRFGCSLELDVTCERLFDAKIVLSGHISRNLAIDMGPAALLAHGNVKIVCTSRTGPHFAPQLFQAAGYDPFHCQAVVCKSPCGFRAVYEARSAQVLNVRTPGCAPPDFWNYPYTKITRPLWPWDEIESFQPQVHVK
jgi:microcystin degradation protein MlrC